MNPNLLYRTPEGYVYEEYSETLYQSILEKASDLFHLIKKDEADYPRSGEDLLEKRLELLDAMTSLKQALDKQLVTTYKLKK